MRILGTKILLALAAMGICSAGVTQSTVTGEPFTLQQAVAIGLRQSPDHQGAALEADSARVDEHLAKSALLPALRFSETASRGNDPVYVFGVRLRQQNFTQADFAPNQLNRPAPIGNFATRFSGDWIAFDSWRTEFAIRSAAERTKSSQSAATRTDQEIVHRIVLSYQGVLIASKQLEVARHQVETAQALLNSSKSRVSSGLAVDSDQLSAEANLAARQQELIAAEGDLQIAWAELERAAGASIPDSARNIPELSAVHFEPSALADNIAAALRTRPDRKSLDELVAADHAEVLAARSSLAPTLRAFGDWEADRGSPAGSGGNNWMAGVELNFDILPFAKRQQLQRARIATERSHVAGRSADAQIRLEVTRAWYAQQAASQMVDVAQAARSQTEENLRILRNRYNAGLATMTDLLRGEDTERETEANYWASVSRSRMVWCDLKFAMGTLNAGNVADLQ